MKSPSLYLHEAMAPSGQPEEYPGWLLHMRVVAWRASPMWLVRSFLSSKDPLTSGQLALLSRSLAELSLFWAFQNVLPISLPAAHPSDTQAFEVGSEVS